MRAVLIRRWARLEVALERVDARARPHGKRHGLVRRAPRHRHRDARHRRNGVSELSGPEDVSWTLWRRSLSERPLFGLLRRRQTRR